MIVRKRLEVRGSDLGCVISYRLVLAGRNRCFSLFRENHSRRSQELPKERQYRAKASNRSFAWFFALVSSSQFPKANRLDTSKIMNVTSRHGRPFGSPSSIENYLAVLGFVVELPPPQPVKDTTQRARTTAIRIRFIVKSS
jgi:hypothetical protein